MFEGKVTTIGASVDPNTRRVLVRSEIKDPQHELRSGMFAEFRHQRRPRRAFAGDPDRRRGARGRRHHDRLGHRRSPPVHPATVKIGEEHDGYRQILDGVQVGELVATEGAMFLSNALATASN